ncbi:class I adenylate-forming enzyme family protein [Nonomuraea gerenzanensis]|uniref:Fatty-acid-CoA ligase FadD7 n=1 Tax=Nonomuraea gerenzanensis TaxID=93944 RepID=A0A1M4ELT4_9ACTN|nr:class I adenylate-forming enzyme family protein [Nonomuraea gerenzanensis]UBU11331.1 acyl--CoA ligase [Nonomuraea gerenzanensis]SBO99809.1 Fatty-acid-CoA ligase FadD7 [Nonomuraea gerenzanensis]
MADVHRYPSAAPARSCFTDFFDEHLRARPDAPYITGDPAGAGAQRTLSYRQLDACSRRLAYWLKGELGGCETVGLIPRNELTSVLTIFAAVRAGYRVLFLSPADPEARLRQQTEALGVTAVLRSAAVPDDACAGAILVPEPYDLPDAGPFAAPAADPGDDVFYFGTSGSTAASKLVAQSRRNVVSNAEAVRRHHGLGPGDRLLGCLPIHHVNGVHFSLMATFMAGAHVVLAGGFDPFAYPRLIERHRPRIASVVPSILETLTATWRRPSLPAEFGYFVSAAAPLPTATARAVRKRLGARVLQGYGLTETTNFSTTMPAGLPEKDVKRFLTEVDVPSIGVAVHGNEVAVLTRDGERAAPGEVGEICMRGHNVMNGYAGNPAATREAFEGGWFHSQDLGFELRDASGRGFFFVTGRLKNIAKVGGESVSLEEMEKVLRAVPYVRDAACVAAPHRYLGEEIVAAVVHTEDAPETVNVRPHLLAAFAHSVVPNRVVRLDAIPRTATGKIRRPELARLLLSPS